MILAGNNHAAARRTMDDQQITGCIPTAYNTHMAVIRVKYQVAGLGALSQGIAVQYVCCDCAPPPWPITYAPLLTL